MAIRLDRQTYVYSYGTSLGRITLAPFPVSTIRMLMALVWCMIYRGPRRSRIYLNGSKISMRRSCSPTENHCQCFYWRTNVTNSLTGSWTGRHSQTFVTSTVLPVGLRSRLNRAIKLTMRCTSWWNASSRIRTSSPRDVRNARRQR